MTYLISQLWLYLLCAGLLGLLLGWVIWGWWSRRLMADARARHEQERLSLESAFEAEKATAREETTAAFMARDEAVKVKASLLGKLEGERKAAAEAKAQLDRLSKTGVTARGDLERQLATMKDQLELERSTAAKAKKSIEAIRVDTDRALQKKEAALSGAASDNEALRAKLEKLEADAKKKQASLAAAESEANLKAELARSEVTRLRSVGGGRSDAGEADVDRLRRTMQLAIDEERRAKAAAEADRSKLLASERDAKAEVERLRSQFAAMSGNGQGDSAEADRLRRELQDARERQRGLETEIARLRTLMSNRETVAVKAAPAAKFTTDAPRPASLFDRRPDQVDDLKEVKGIGPVMERILNENGCYHFKQLANFSSRDIEWISQALGSFPDRIDRDEWVGQAQTLYLRKYGRRHDVGEVKTLETTS